MSKKGSTIKQLTSRKNARTLRDREPVAENSVHRAFESIGVDFSSSARLIETLPFSLNDTTVGSESELQTAVLGESGDVDLAVEIRESSFFANVIQRLKAGETSKKLVSDIEGFIDSNREKVWENSWVRFPLDRLCNPAKKILFKDLQKNKKDPSSGFRSDVKRFFFHKKGKSYLRIPISYLLKLALADFLGSSPTLPRDIQQTGSRLQDHFLNDNTSPETHSFYISPLWSGQGNGKVIARETCQRFLLTQLLVMYSNTKLGLKDEGQEAIIFHSPHPPIRQKKLNECIPDSFYRELFMSPCISGWDKGEEKHRYMSLCHEVLSRSQLNTLTKLREAGIITRNLMILPNTSNISLANNGTHLSLGSLKLTAALKAGNPEFSAKHEKYIGDLVVKIMEHFLPLFVGLYSAAPYRMEFYDFHPEKALGFLPHQLHYTHLRMFWRRWKKKAKLKVFNRPVTPFGPMWLDKMINDICGFRGDYIPDFRLVDYMVALLSTEGCPALDGSLGNQERLSRDLGHLGVFHEKMAPYMFFRQRQLAVMGYSGFEGRFYSLFESMHDMAEAANLQVLITALAYKLIASGKVGHRSIPNSPFLESERRQVAFGAAIGIPTFYVRKETENFYLRSLLKGTPGIRSSSRYAGYLRVPLLQFQRGLLGYLKTEAAGLISILGMENTIQDLEDRIENPVENSTSGRITQGILEEAGTSSPFKLSAGEINSSAETYYRNKLRFKHIGEGLDELKNDFLNDRDLIRFVSEQHPKFLNLIYENQLPKTFFESAEDDLVKGTLSEQRLRKLITLILLSVAFQTRKNDALIAQGHGKLHATASVY